MATKKAPAAKPSKKLESFNKSQEIYQVLEKGIIESEALLNSAADRPDDDAHIVELLESTSGESASRFKSKASGPAKKSSAKGSKSQKARRR